MSPDSLAVKLRNARGALDLAEAAVRSGILPDKIREYEAGARRPYTKTLKRLAQVYGVPLAEFMVADGTASRVSQARRSPRRRRPLRASAAPAISSSDTIRVPVDIGTEPTVRIVIELIVQMPPAQQVAAAGGGAAEPAEPAEARPASTPALVPASSGQAPRVRSWQRDRAREKAAINAARPLAAGESGAGAGEVPSIARPAPLPRPDSGTDPLAAVRRAYSEFRQKK